jgi:hypothetical protein
MINKTIEARRDRPDCHRFWLVCLATADRRTSIQSLAAEMIAGQRMRER